MRKSAGGLSHDGLTIAGTTGFCGRRDAGLFGRIAVLSPALILPARW
ncbi:hypothetical protein [Pannonibacter carbonis]|nr:hypothetical protein [Pannonibacter carbonis]